jgi:hypothetical protein
MPAQPSVQGTAMNLFDDKDGPTADAPAGDLVKGVEILTSPAQVILDIRKDIEAFKNGGSRKELVEALKDQFIATRHQAATKAEATRILALNILQARLPEIKSTAELLRAISVLSAASENDLAVVLDAVPGSGALINVQQSAAGCARWLRPAIMPGSRVGRLMESDSYIEPPPKPERGCESLTSPPNA